MAKKFDKSNLGKGIRALLTQPEQLEAAVIENAQQVVTELAGNIARRRCIKDDIGDMVVVLTIIAKQSGTTLQECLAHAYNDIKDRKGRMVDGVFVKEEICTACGSLLSDCQCKELTQDERQFLEGAL